MAKSSVLVVALLIAASKSASIEGFDSDNCPECCEYTAACAEDSTCTTLAEYITTDLGQCFVGYFTDDNVNDTNATYYGIPYSDAIYQQFVFPYWCTGYDFNQSLDIDCDAIGLTDWYSCATTNACFKIYGDDAIDYWYGGGSSDDGNNCCVNETSACLNDTVCLAAVSGEIQFDDNGNVYGDIYDFCDGQDCTALQDLLSCFSSCGNDGSYCNETAEDYDCFSCATNNGLDIVDCVFQTDCYPALNGTLIEVFDGYCDDVFCTPDKLQQFRSDYCDDTATDCSNTLFNSIWNGFYNCSTSECVWQYCTDEITTCDNDATCSEELDFVVNIEDAYDAPDDNFMRMVKDWYCSNRPGGSCTDELNTAYSCVANSSCLDFSADQCYETSCASEVAACEQNDNCLDTLMWTIGNETECEQAIPEMGGDYAYCPDNCDDLSIDNFTPCGDYGYGTDYDTYYLCKSACDDCDNFLDIGLANCGNGECSPEYPDLMNCILVNCPDNDGEDDDECFSTCSTQVVNCMFDEECYEDWSYLDNYDGFKYNSTWDEPGCTEDDWTEIWTALYNEPCDTTAYYELIYQCLYYDTRTYCEDEEVNPDGCSLDFWSMYNCIFSCAADIDTVFPTTSPSAQPTAEDMTSTSTTEDSMGGNDTTTTGSVGGQPASANSLMVLPIILVVTLLSFVVY